MRRFYCSICQKVKHVRVMPSTVKTPNAENPRDRVGECRWHRDESHRSFLNGQLTPKKPSQAKPKKSAQPEVSPKKGGKR